LLIGSGEVAQQRSRKDLAAFQGLDRVTDSRETIHWV
jgi:hypothetical protein